MAGKRPSVYLTEQSTRYLAKRADSLSGAINQTVDRYEQVIKQTALPPFTAEEIHTLLEATMGVLYQPAEMIAHLWHGIEDQLADDLTGEISEPHRALIEKLKKLTYPQEVALLEKLEQRRQRRD